MNHDYKAVCEEIVKSATSKGADQCDVLIELSRESEIGTRMEQTETVKESLSAGLGIRVIKNKKTGFVYTSNFAENNIDNLINKAIEHSHEATEDRFNGLADSFPENLPELNLFDPEISKLSTDDKINYCQKMEKGMFAYDKRIQNSQGAYFLDGESTSFLANSAGFYHSYKSTYCFMQCSPVAVQGQGLQAGYWFSFSRFLKDLELPDKIAETAALRTVRMLGAITPKTTSVPVVFDPQTAGSLIGIIPTAVNGDSIFKRASFLVDKLGQSVAAENVVIRDNGILEKGTSSAPIDGDGQLTNNKAIIENGVLQTYLYDIYTSRKTGGDSTSNAQRDYSSTPQIGSFNVYLEPGKISHDEIIASVKDGLYITSLMGFGINMVTGDYSRGASGLWIENGKLSYPVEGVTIAGNLIDMFSNIEMIGNDLVFMGPVSSPTVKISKMTVAGM